MNHVGEQTSTQPRKEASQFQSCIIFTFIFIINFWTVKIAQQILTQTQYIFGRIQRISEILNKNEFRQF